MRLRLVSWVVIALLVANLIVYFWPRQVASPSGAEFPRGIERLVLVDELETPPLPRDRGEAAVAPAPVEETPPEAQPEADPPPTCWWAGPVAGSNEAALFNTLANAGVTPQTGTRTGENFLGYWVHLPVGADRVGLNEAYAELSDLGFENYPITEGELAGSLSMGLFREADRAEQLRRRLGEAGYSAAIARRTEPAEQRWLMLTGADIDKLGWPTTGSPPGFENLAIESRVCGDPPL